MTTANTDLLNEIIDMLPPEIEEADRRKHNLTRSDLMLIAKLIDAKSGHIVCSQFTQDEIVVGRKLIGAFNKTATIVGTLILTAIVIGAIGLTAKGFWATVYKMVTGGEGH